MSQRALGEQFRNVVTHYPDGTYSSKQVAQQDLDKVSAQAKPGVVTQPVPQGPWIAGAKQRASISVQPVRRDKIAPHHA